MSESERITVDFLYGAVQTTSIVYDQTSTGGSRKMAEFQSGENRSYLRPQSPQSQLGEWGGSVLKQETLLKP